MTTVGEAATEDEAATVSASVRPDVILLEAGATHHGVGEAIRRLRPTSHVGGHACAVVVLTSQDDDESLYYALRAGVDGYLLKDVTEADFITAMWAVAAGGAVISPKMVKRLIDRFEIFPPRDRQYYSNLFSTLTDREFEVMLCIGHGLSNRQTAEKLHVAETTVKSHVSNLMGKLGVATRTEAALLAQESGPGCRAT